MLARLVQAVRTVVVVIVSAGPFYFHVSGLDAAPVAARVKVPENLETSTTVQVGANLFRENCVQCHGAPGIAPTVQGLTPAPLDLLRAGRRNDPADVFSKIKKGIPGTAMPAWDQLPDQSIWALAAFLHNSRGISADAFDAISSAKSDSKRGARTQNDDTVAGRVR
jgi:mono/diheme cytochrome c family protein